MGGQACAADAPTAAMVATAMTRSGARRRSSACLRGRDKV